MNKLRLAAASAALLAIASAAWGQGVSISNLPAATTPLTGSELTPLVQSSTTKRATVADFVNLASKPFTGLSFNKVTITPPATGSTLTIADAKTLTVNNSPVITGTDGTYTFQGTGTYVSRTSTDTLTGKTFDTAGSGNSLLINGLAATANTGTGAVARAVSPAFTTPNIGVATATSVNGLALTASTGTVTVANGKTLTANNTVTLAGGDGSTVAVAASKTLTVSNSITLTGTDATSMAFPSTSATLARTDAAQTFAGTQTFSGQVVTSTGLPTIANGACGAGANGAVAAGSTNQSGQITIGASATTTCTIVFSATLGAAPKSCHIQPANAAAAATGTTVAYVSSITTAQFVITGSALANANYGFFCL